MIVAQTGRTMWTVRLALANSIGFSLTTILPLWVAALPTALGVPTWQVSLVGSLQLGMCGLFNVAAPWLAARRAPLTVARTALLVAGFGCLGEGAALGIGHGSLIYFGLAAMLAGGACGVLLAMTNRLMAGTDHVQHGYAVFQIVEVCFASTLFVVGAALVRNGAGMLFLAASAICLCGLVALYRLPGPERALGTRLLPATKPTLKHRAKKWEPVFGIKRCNNKNLERADDSHFALPALDGALLLCAMLFFFSGQSSINSFLIPIGAQSGLGYQTVARIVGAGMVFALAGATAARILGERFGTIAPLIVVGVLMALDFVLITWPAPALGFAIGAALIPSGTIFIVPYFFTALAGVDREGRFASLGPAFLIGGVALGPLISGLVGHASSYARLGEVSALLAIIGIGIAAIGIRAANPNSASDLAS